MILLTTLEFSDKTSFLLCPCQEPYTLRPHRLFSCSVPFQSFFFFFFIIFVPHSLEVHTPFFLFHYYISNYKDSSFPIFFSVNYFFHLLTPTVFLISQIWFSTWSYWMLASCCAFTSLPLQESQRKLNWLGDGSDFWFDWKFFKTVIAIVNTFIHICWKKDSTNMTGRMRGMS